MNKSFLFFTALAALVLGSLAFTGKGDDPKYKNLKILPKDITEQQMDSVMDHFTASLNVKCGFCHVRTADKKEWNFAADDNKHKLIARQMMTMTNELNKKYFDYTGDIDPAKMNTSLMVTCYTCHNGRKEPLAIPVKKEEKQASPTGQGR
jgi:hypothetical protein